MVFLAGIRVNKFDSGIVKPSSRYQPKKSLWPTAKLDIGEFSRCIVAKLWMLALAGMFIGVMSLVAISCSGTLPKLKVSS